jgi:hypothetical protein
MARSRLPRMSSFRGEYLCNKNAVTHNPVKGVERPKIESGEGKTPAIADHQARKLLAAGNRPETTASNISPTQRGLGGSTIRHRPASLASLFALRAISGASIQRPAAAPTP